jgi:hypothetical protein
MWAIDIFLPYYGTGPAAKLAQGASAPLLICWGRLRPVLSELSMPSIDGGGVWIRTRDTAWRRR